MMYCGYLHTVKQLWFFQCILFSSSNVSMDRTSQMDLYSKRELFRIISIFIRLKYKLYSFPISFKYRGHIVIFIKLFEAYVNKFCISQLNIRLVY